MKLTSLSDLLVINAEIAEALATAGVLHRMSSDKAPRFLASTNEVIAASARVLASGAALPSHRLSQVVEQLEALAKETAEAINAFGINVQSSDLDKSTIELFLDDAELLAVEVHASIKELANGTME